MLLCLLAVAVSAGCQSYSASSYISPRVTGRVLAADTRQPLAKVQVKRVNPMAGPSESFPARGGQSIEANSGAWTDAQGKFVLDAERDLTFLRQQVWYSVTVSFQREGYQTLRTNFTVSNVASNAPNGMPVVNAGDILLQPASP